MLFLLVNVAMAQFKPKLARKKKHRHVYFYETEIKVSQKFQINFVFEQVSEMNHL